VSKFAARAPGLYTVAVGGSGFFFGVTRPLRKQNMIKREYHMLHDHMTELRLASCKDYTTVSQMASKRQVPCGARGRCV